ncbi:MAG: hypothetical protein ABF932_13550 [Gluconobacter potus]|uniref:Glycine-rich domain-containing protein n=1 Tax=Gluconobacter potus TaxID=2724927 RepID=A0ABR9YNZ3_9PROT|nr:MULTISPECIES: hypothetical protein [Gluconobacter]MBF0865134.1 hypothetical protein [Gluconobacter sp. R71656]MBF0868356.1 hypothetical protein [Gluconobacter sp. R75628]MBF0874272.1 hypothetical protein [Gluconobacter sp. R75629]MBF0883329.1 hypothetical protein [Gluconobacter potus]
MQSANFPTKIAVPFGASATSANIRTIPVTAADAVSASFNLGFPPNTMIPTDAGGTPPDGRDMNGILFMTTALLQQYCAGMVPRFDAAFQTAVGGYPIGCVIQDATTAGKYWRSTADANLTVPGASGASWVDFFSGVQSGRLLSVTNYTANTTYTPSASATKILVEMVGAGGAAGGCPAAAGTNYASVSTAGAAGAFIRALFDLSKITLSAVPLTIGAGGVGAEGASGGTGGNTLFGGWLTAGGGSGGTAGTSTAPSAGGWTSQSGGGATVVAAATGLTVLDAVQGANGMNSLLVPNGSNPGLPLPALGANSPFGTGGNNSVNTTSTAITTDAPRGYGSGSGASGSQLGATTGGTGASGLIRIWEYS